LRPAAVALPFGCNNPAPAVANDGSYVLLVCTWSVHKAKSFAGPWEKTLGATVPALDYESFLITNFQNLQVF
jgi:hypothetical protein